MSTAEPCALCGGAVTRETSDGTEISVIEVDDGTWFPCSRCGGTGIEPEVKPDEEDET